MSGMCNWGEEGEGGGFLSKTAQDDGSSHTMLP